jgi:hypothetical protein
VGDKKSAAVAADHQCNPEVGDAIGYEQQPKLLASSPLRHCLHKEGKRFLEALLPDVGTLIVPEPNHNEIV